MRDIWENRKTTSQSLMNMMMSLRQPTMSHRQTGHDKSLNGLRRGQRVKKERFEGYIPTGNIIHIQLMLGQPRSLRWGAGSSHGIECRDNVARDTVRLVSLRREYHRNAPIITRVHVMWFSHCQIRPRPRHFKGEYDYLPGQMTRQRCILTVTP